VQTPRDEAVNALSRRADEVVEQRATQRAQTGQRLELAQNRKIFSKSFSSQDSMRGAFVGAALRCVTPMRR